MTLWLFYGRNFKEKFKARPRIFEVQNSEEFRQNPTRRSGSTRLGGSVWLLFLVKELCFYFEHD